MDRYEIVCGTHPGRVRSGNEDAVFAEPALGLAILADGMGGYAAGEIASRIAVDEIAAELSSALRHLLGQGNDIPCEGLHEDLRFAAGRANTAILERARRDPDCDGMGATLVSAVLQPERISIAHLGDSRAYRLREARLEQLTRDHCWMDEQIAQGELSVDALLNPRYKNIVTRALGIEDEIELEVHDHPALEGDLFLLCSDGLSDMLETPEIESILLEDGGLEEKVGKLIERANHKGGRDNISVILLRRAPSVSGGWTSRLMRRIQGQGA